MQQASGAPWLLPVRLTPLKLIASATQPTQESRLSSSGPKTQETPKQNYRRRCELRVRSHSVRGYGAHQLRGLDQLGCGSSEAPLFAPLGALAVDDRRARA